MSVAGAIAVGLAGYLIGSISFARIVARRALPGVELEKTELTWGEDQLGFTTDNVSATSVAQHKGPRTGCLISLFDIAKAFAPVLTLGLVYPDASYDVVYGITVTAGHNLPLYYRFKGGRGTTTILGALLALDPISIPVTIILGYLIGFFVFKDVLLAHHAGWIVLLPFWFAAWGRWDLVVFSVAVNVLRWGVSGSEIRDYLSLRRSGALRTREFHETIEKTHIGFLHGVLRRRGWITYDYMHDDS